MKKLRLELEDLSVESFSTAQEPEPRGTVHANTWDYSYCNYSKCLACMTNYGGPECNTDQCESFSECPTTDTCPPPPPPSTRPACGPVDPY